MTHLFCAAKIFQQADHFTKYQDAIENILTRDLVWDRSPPDPEQMARSRKLLDLAFFSHLAMGIDDQSGSSEQDARRRDGEAILAFFNGNWLQRAIVHHCQGCCQNATDAAELLFAVAIALNIWLSSDVRLPSVDDWRSCGESSGRISLGMMAHDILGHSFNYGCLSWAQIGDLDLEQEHEGEENDIDHVRRKIQKKCWRSQCVLKDSKQRRRMLLLTWHGAPLEALILTLQTLDGNKRALLDLQIAGDSFNPFLRRRRAIASLLRGGRCGGLEPLYTDLLSSEHAQLDAEVRLLGQDFSAQVKWRFQGLHEFPYSFCHMEHPRVSKADKLETLNAFFNRKKCCLERDFALKIFL